MFDFIRRLLTLNIAKPVMVAAATADPLLKAEHWYEMQALLRVGDVLITKTNGVASNPIIPGFYSHSAMYVGNQEGVYRCVDSSVPMVEDIDVLDLIMHVDHVAVMRPSMLSVADRLLAAENARALVGKTYDYAFRFDNDDIYCSEVIFKSIVDIDPRYREIFNTFKDPFCFEIITPQSIRDHEGWELVFESPLE